MDAPVIAGRKLAIVPVLRAGLGMADGLLELIPSARVGHIGVYRNEEKRPVEYYVRLPEIEDRSFIVCDPMIGTGHSAAHAVGVLKGRGVPAERIRFVALVASPEGVAEYQRQHPDVPMYVAALDERLDAHAHIVPGLGDAGIGCLGRSERSENPREVTRAQSEEELGPRQAPSRARPLCTRRLRTGGPGPPPPRAVVAARPRRSAAQGC